MIYRAVQLSRFLAPTDELTHKGVPRGPRGPKNHSVQSSDTIFPEVRFDAIIGCFLKFFVCLSNVYCMYSLHFLPLGITHFQDFGANLRILVFQCGGPGSAGLPFFLPNLRQDCHSIFASPKNLPQKTHLVGEEKE